jgi:hypothetical protein
MYALHTICALTILLNTGHIHSMENDHEQLVLQTEQYNNDRLPNDVLICIFSHYVQKDILTEESLENYIKDFMQLSMVCKQFNTILSYEIIADFCKKYDHITSWTVTNKNRIMNRLIAYDNYIRTRTPALILICGGVDLHAGAKRLLEKAILNNDTQLVVTFYTQMVKTAYKENVYDPSFLLHELATRPNYYCYGISDKKNFLNLLVNNMSCKINTLDKERKTALDIAQERLQESQKKLKNFEVIYGKSDDFELLIRVFKEHGALTAQACKQLAVQTATHNNNHLFLKLSEEILIEIFSYCLAQDELFVDEKEKFKPCWSCMQQCMRMKFVCKKINTLLTFKGLDSFCRNYPLINKNATLLRHYENIIAVEEFMKNGPALLEKLQAKKTAEQARMKQIKLTPK